MLWRSKVFVRREGVFILRAAKKGILLKKRTLVGLILFAILFWYLIYAAAVIGSRFTVWLGTEARLWF